MKSKFSALMFVAAMLLFAGAASADDYDDTIAVFKKSGESAAFFNNSHGYAVFPSIGKGGLGVGAAHGSGRVYEQGKYVGDVKMNQISVGLQAGGQAFSQIIFFEDKRSFDEFIERQLRVRRDGPGRGDYRLGDCQRRIDGYERGRCRRPERCEHGRAYRKGMAVFTIAKGGLMYQAAIGGQKFKYKAKK